MPDPSRPADGMLGPGGFSVPADSSATDSSATDPSNAAPWSTASYRLGGCTVALHHPLAELEPFLDDREPASETRAAAEHEEPISPLEPATDESFDRHGHVARRERRLHCRWTAAGCRLTIPDLGRFTVAADGGAISWRVDGPDPDAATGLAAEAVLGPPLVLALALQGVFCLHASALTVGTADGSHVVAFVGDSGAGKSTTAATLVALSAGGLGAWRAVRLAADDILPWRPGATPCALPRFPQLKYEPAAQPSLELPEQLPFGEIVVLEAAMPDGRIVDSRMSRHESALALLRHSVASTLFPRPLLARHFEVCSSLAALVPMRRMRVPRRPGALVELFERLEDGPRA